MLVQLLAWLACCGITWADPSLGGQQPLLGTTHSNGLSPLF